MDSRRTRPDRPDSRSCRPEIYRRVARLWTGVAICWTAGPFMLKFPPARPVVEASLDFISPAARGGHLHRGCLCHRPVIIVNWNALLLYPAGWTSDELTYKASLRLPAQLEIWHIAAVASQSGSGNPFRAGFADHAGRWPRAHRKYLKVVPLNAGQTPPAEMDVAADSAAALDAPAEVWEHYRNLVQQAGTSIWGAALSRLPLSLHSERSRGAFRPGAS